MPLQDYYRTLGIAATATAAEVKKAYRSLVLQYHPDRNTGGGTTSEARFLEVQEAYDVLGNTARRARYDEERWLSGMDKRSRRQVANTPDAVRDEMIQVCRSLDGLDTHRIDKGVLNAYLLHLLRPARVEMLLAEGTAIHRREIAEALLPRMRLLAPPDYAAIAGILLQLAAADDALTAHIHNAAKAYRGAQRQKRWEPYLLLLLAVLICGLMLWYGRRN